MKNISKELWYRCRQSMWHLGYNCGVTEAERGLMLLGWHNNYTDQKKLGLGELWERLVKL